MLPWIIGFAAVVVFLFLAEREIHLYEGAHLGPRVQGWLYNRWAARYDRGKQQSQSNDVETLAHPLIKRLDEAHITEAFVLDVATGTGRLPAVLLNDPAFKGRIVALDLSRTMLVRAAQKLAPFGDRVVLVRHSALALPFLDHSFDVVSCVEALELMPDMKTPLAELARVLRPGGVLLTTRGTEASGRWGRIASAERFTALLHGAGFEQVEIIPWWKNFDRVWARKPGQSAPASYSAAAGGLRCPTCGAVALAAASPHALCCEECHTDLDITPEGIILC